MAKRIVVTPGEPAGVGPELMYHLTQKDFAEIMKVQPKAPTHSSPADSKELSKVPERAR